MKPLGPFRHWKHMLRYRQVANALAHHGFDLMFGRAQRRGDGAPLNGVVSAAPEHLRRTLEELGPTFVKLGQLLSTRPDLISREYIKELEKLQDHVPPFPYEQVRQVLAEEGVDVDLHFAHLEPEPFASASIGQVHEGVLRSGERVVVKVQRPGIQQVVETDLEILYELAQLAERRTGWGKLYRITDIVREFAQALRKEMDFAQEGRNADKFRRNFAGSETVLIPRVFWQVTTPRVLVLEYVGGVKVSDVEALKAAGYDLTRVAAHVVEALFHQIYTHGFFHADPHPGNLAVTEGEKIIFYDFGQVGTIDELLKETCMDLVMAMVRYDVRGVTRALLQIGIATEHVNREEFRRDVSRLQQKYYGMPLSQIEMGQALGELVQLSFKYSVRVPPELSLIVKMLMTMEGLIIQLNPELSIVDIAEPFGREILRSRMSVRKMGQGIWEMVLDHYHAARNLPREMESVMSLLEEGELKIKMEHVNLRRMASTIDVITNRIVLAIIIASIIMGASMLVSSSRETFVPGVPLVQIGLGVGVVLGLFLAYSIIRSGRY